MAGLTAAYLLLAVGHKVSSDVIMAPTAAYKLLAVGPKLCSNAMLFIKLSSDVIMAPTAQRLKNSLLFVPNLTPT